MNVQAVRRAALGALIAMMLPLTAHAQTGKHIAIGASVAAHDYTSDRIRQGVGIMLLYRVAPNGDEENGLSWGPSATIGFSRADVSSDVAGGDVTVGKLQSIPALVGFGPHYRHGRWWTGLSVTAGASFNSFTIDDAARQAYEERAGEELESVDAKTAFAVQPGVSVWYDVGSRLGLYGGVSYFYSRPKAAITAGGVTTTETWNSDYLGLSVGAVLGVF
jgi:hypothetical protein